MKNYAKELVRALIYPWRRYFDPRLKHLGLRIDLLQHRIDEVERKADPSETSWVDEYLPVILNVISSQNAASREARRSELELRAELAAVKEMGERIEKTLAEPPVEVWRDEINGLRRRLDELGPMLAERISQVEARGEFVRREVLYETRYGAKGKGMDPEGVTPSTMLVPSDGKLRLNLGCGHTPLKSFVNVDGRDLPGVDVVARVGALPAEPGSVDEIFSAHLLEHFAQEELSRKLLPYWFGLLKPGGVFTAVVPDSETMIAEYSAGRLSFADLRLVTFGEQEYDGDFHFNMFSKDLICALLRDAGFTGVRLVEEGRRNGICYEMEVTCERPRIGE